MRRPGPTSSLLGTLGNLENRRRPLASAEGREQAMVSENASYYARIPPDSGEPPGHSLRILPAVSAVSLALVCLVCDWCWFLSLFGLRSLSVLAVPRLRRFL